MPKQQQTQRIRVIDNVIISPNYKLLRLEKSFDFIASQIVSIAIQPRAVSRMYSIASAPSDSTIDILYALQANGELTPQLWNLQTGDYVFCSPPSGHFAASNRPMTWIASGTGIAPFVSMFRSGYNTDIQLLHGARRFDEFYNQNQFSSVLGDKYIRCCSSTSGEPSVFTGRVNDFLQQNSFFDPKRYYLLCGRSEMVVDVRDLLLTHKIPFTQISAEIYF